MSARGESWVVVNIDTRGPARENFPASVHWYVGTARNPVYLSSDGAYDVHDQPTVAAAKRVALKGLKECMVGFGNDGGETAMFGIAVYNDRVFGGYVSYGQLATVQMRGKSVRFITGKPELHAMTKGELKAYAKYKGV